jgi:hypothetical protein
MSAYSSAFGVKRTSDEAATWLWSDAIDPNRTLAARDFCGAHCRTVCQFRLAHFPVLMA